MMDVGACGEESRLYLRNTNTYTKTEEVMRKLKFLLVAVMVSLLFTTSATAGWSAIKEMFTEVQKAEEVVIEGEETPVEEIVYTTTYLNVREAPGAESNRVGVLSPGSKLVRVGASDVDGWDKIKIGDAECFVCNQYITSETPESVVEVFSIEEIKVQEQQAQSPEYQTITYSKPAQSYAGTSAKEIIAWRESRGDYNAISSSGRYVGRYQLTNTMLNGDYSPENQERVADTYVQQRYGSWEAALAFHNAHGWY